jgi:hypothetical protein
MSTTIPVSSLSSVPDPPARLLLEAGRTRGGMLDGAWWPRSRHAKAELTALIAEVTAQVGPVFRVGLNHAAWDSQPGRVVSGGRAVKIGWYGPTDPHAISITGGFPNRLDLLVIPPEADAASAEAAMRTAGDASSTARATAVLTSHGIDTGTGPRSDPPPARRGRRTATLSVVGAAKPGVTNGHRPSPGLQPGTAELGS